MVGSTITAKVAIRGEVIDIFPSGPTPYRLTIDDGRISAIHAYDPTTQRTTATTGRLVIAPSCLRWVALPGAEPILRYPGMEHWLPDYYTGLRTVFDLLPGAALMIEPGADSRLDEALALAGNNYRDSAASPAARDPGTRKPLPPEALYLTSEEWHAQAGVRRISLAVDEPTEVVPRFYTDRQPRRRLAAFVAAKIAAGQRIVLAGVSARDRTALAKAIDAVVVPPIDAACWAEIEAAAPGTVTSLSLSAEHGFIDTDAGIVLVAAADLLGGGAERAPPPPPSRRPGAMACRGWRVRDRRHRDPHRTRRGRLAVPRDPAVRRRGGRGTRCGSTTPRRPISWRPSKALDRLWRYGSAGDAIRLDRLDSDAWSKRRQRIAGEIAETARALVALARARAETEAPSLKSPARSLQDVLDRLSILADPRSGAGHRAAVIDDLAAGRPMDRLVVGDVGFGKTEVALRAAAVAVLAGRQVALVAPTTVLVRQHVQTFTRRFAELGIAVGHLSRLTPAGRGRSRKGRPLADGSLRIVVGTHAVAAESVVLRGSRPRDRRRGTAVRHGRESEAPRARQRDPRPDPHGNAHPAHFGGGAGRAAGSQHHGDASGPPSADPNPGGAL